MRTWLFPPDAQLHKSRKRYLIQYLASEVNRKAVMGGDLAAWAGPTRSVLGIHLKRDAPADIDPPEPDGTGDKRLQFGDQPVDK